jgi:hypothetical protein
MLAEASITLSNPAWMRTRTFLGGFDKLVLNGSHPAENGYLLNMLKSDKSQFQSFPH